MTFLPLPTVQFSFSCCWWSYCVLVGISFAFLCFLHWYKTWLSTCHVPPIQITFPDWINISKLDKEVTVITTLMAAGVSKLGSPYASQITRTPASTSAVAWSVIASVWRIQIFHPWVDQIINWYNRLGTMSWTCHDTDWHKVYPLLLRSAPRKN